MRDPTIQAETIEIPSGGDQIEAYVAHPVRGPPAGGVVVIHHMPGYDRGTKEIVRRFADLGYAAICPNLHHRDAPGADPDDAAAASRANGGVPDERLVQDVGAAATYLRSLPSSNGKGGVIGYCSGGRQAVLAACSTPLDAAVDCYGAWVPTDPPESLRVHHWKPIPDLLPDLCCPLLGLFGQADQNPAPAEVAGLDERLTKLGKDHESHSYPGAGHAFFAVDRPSYRPAAALPAWDLIRDFYGRHLST